MRSLFTQRFIPQFAVTSLALLLAAAPGVRAQNTGANVPFPKAHHDAQNTGRALDEQYLGVTDGNRTWDQGVFNRLGSLDLDGWVFPRDAANPGLPGAFTQRPSVNLDNFAAVQIGQGTATPGANWGAPVIGPSLNYLGNNYHRIPAVTRTDAGVAAPNLFTWQPEVPGAANTQTRYAIFVYVPTPSQDTTALEARVTDARYRVVYTLRNPQTGNAVVRSKYFTVAQDAEGWQPLRNEDGSVPFFPFYSDASYGGVAGLTERARVELDNTTDDGDLGNKFVIADAIRFVQQFDVVRATPTLTARHGGRRAAGGTQPGNGAGYTAADFIGFTDDPANPSTLFQGPNLFVDASTTLPSTNDPRFDTYPSPLFSHMQVLVARTEFVPDPEIGVRVSDLDGTKSLEVGAVYGLDWLTGAPIWRFPDASYLPGGARNPQIGTDADNRPRYQIPGINTIDKNLDGAISADEVYIVGQPAAFATGSGQQRRTERLGGSSGGLSGAVTFAINVPILGNVTLPGGGTKAYVSGGGGPVSVPVAYVGANNGVLYALDPYGNNDNQYAFVGANAGTAIAPQSFTPGTTNALWTFSATVRDRNRGETASAYSTYLKAQVPATSAFGASSPVIAYESITPANPLTDEQRLFIGNENGVLYALTAGALSSNGGTPGPLPLRKGENTGPFAAYATDLRWWFETQGAIAATPAVSRDALFAQAGSIPGPPGQPALPLLTRGVYVSTLEGRVYCLDWEGPVTKSNHDGFVLWDGTGNGAEDLNDSYRFHNGNDAGPTTENGTHGTIRPRWVFPNRYTDINGAFNKDDQPDNATARRITGGNANVPLAAPSNLAPIYSAPVLMEFLYDEDGNAATPSVSRNYVVVAANDPTSSGSPINGNLYLLDAAGDRRSFLTNPFAKGTGAAEVAISHPLDRFTPQAAFGNAAPAWTYRFEYGTDPQTRNTPVQTGDTAAQAATRAEPSRRLLPTVFAGGVGRLYAVDIDAATGVFTRWRPAGQTQPTPISTPAQIVPADIPAVDTAGVRLDPPNPDVAQANLENRPILARTTDFLTDSSRVDGQIVITGGPRQNRGAAPATPTNDPLGTDVNQDIHDPLATSAGTVTGYDPNDPNYAFQFPAIFVTTAAGFLHEVSTNIEGEDPSSIGQVGIGNESSATGWALTTDVLRTNPAHVLLDGIEGPGGASGVSVLTNAYFPGLDPTVGAYPDPTQVPPTGYLQPRALAAADTHTGQTGFPLDHNGLFYDPQGAGANQAGNVQLPDYGPNGVPNGTRAFNLPPDPILDDINPEANRVAWVFAGGPDGVTYAFTPVKLGGGGGYGNTTGGRRVVRPNLSTTGDPKVDIFPGDENPNTNDYFTQLLLAAQSGAATRPDRGQSVAALGNRKNFYEWGETIYIVAWDLNAATAATAGDGTYYAQGNSVRITITNRQTGTTLLSTEVPLSADPAAPGIPSTYPYDPSYQIPPQPVPPGTTPVPLGLAFYKFRLGESSAGSPQTPGAYLEIRVAQTLQVSDGPGSPTRTITVGNNGTGANSAAILNNLAPVFAIANPIGIQAFLGETTLGAPANPNNPNGVANAIGPFANSDAAKNAVATAAGDPDPDKTATWYNQALANGNVIERRNFDPYLRGGATLQRNQQFTLRLSGDPVFYLPVAAGAGFASHGSTGSTDVTPNQRYLRLLNRSRLEGGLNKVRSVTANLLRRAWPGAVPNADAGTGNPRRTPVGMRDDGVINPLPWETPPTEAQPWKRAGVDLTASGSVALGINPSQDYPDIGSNTISVNGPSGDLTGGRGSLPSQGTNNSQIFTGLTNPLIAPSGNVAASVSIKVPQYQPADLAAIDSLTSTYIPPSSSDGVLITGTEGPVQLPRGIASRRLAVNGTPVIAPFGYTARLFLYVDSNGDGRLNLATNSLATSTGVDFNNPGIRAQAGYEEAYREFEVWVGIPVDQKMKAVESVVDVGAEGHGFGMQNGLLGYGTVAPPLGLGFIPDPLAPGYAQAFKNFTVQNLGNVNLWNLRAAQRVSQQPAGVPFSFLGMLSDIVDPRFGIGPITADPNPTGIMPLMVTSLDQNLDSEWNTRTLAAGYPVEYAQFGGRHTLHKAVPGAVSPTLLSLPDSPASAPLTPNLIFPPKVGVAVPLGTPVGVYATRTGFPIFEDHDTDASYAAVPTLQGGVITPAGPMYGGSNAVHPGSTRQILPVEGVFRPRRIVTGPGGQPVREFQPNTEPSFVLKATVTETGLTGQVPDSASSIVNGLLPGVDLFPLIDAASARPASALTPAAYRSRANGSLHVYFSRNATGAGAAAAAPGQPFRLFHTHLNWSTQGGYWLASSFGAPVADPLANATGRWFSAPAVIAAGSANASNTAPFVLHDTTDAQGDTSAAGDGATLFWLNTESTPGGTPVNNIYFAVIDPATGVPGNPTPFLDLTNANVSLRADPTLRRFAPRAVVAYPQNTKTMFVFYFGGVNGRFSLYYAATEGGASGEPLGAPRRTRGLPAERALAVPAALVSASEPSAVYHLIQDPNNPSQTIPVLDIYYTGISRANQNPDVYMTRYQILGSGYDARLEPLALTQVFAEKLNAPGRDPMWQSEHISWQSGLNDNPNTAVDDRLFLPQIYIQRAGTPAPVPLQPNTQPANTPTSMQRAWRLDEGTGQLFQSFQFNGANGIVYLDTSAGTIRFQGPAGPSGRDVIYADYTPQTYRITQDIAGDTGATAFLDRTALPATTPANGYTNSVLRRSSNMRADRQWIIWQKGARAGRAATLYHTTRRVGIDLKALPAPPLGAGMDDDESLLLSDRDASGNQQVAISSLTVAGFAVPYDVDFKNGRVYVESRYEGLPYQITYTATSGPPATNRTATATGALGWVDEGAAAQMISMQRSVNEGQAAAFQDLFDPRSSFPDRVTDPTLQPGRIWMFWTSPRGRTGLFVNPNTNQPFASGYDIFWQTIAPYFDASSFSGLPPLP